VKPDCYGKFMFSLGENCDQCMYRMDCYKIFKDKEKQVEKLLKKNKYLTPSFLSNICTTCD